VARLKTAFTNNAALRFRTQSLHARYLAYERLWLRAAREREEGRYRRDLFKARLHARGAEAATSAAGAQPGAAAAQEGPAVPPGAVDPQRVNSTSARGGSAPTGAPQQGAPTGGPDGVGEREMRALYDAYVSAKRSCNEDVSRLTYEAMAKSVARQVPEILSRSKAKAVEFKVVVKDGRAVLKAVLKS
jgi:uncharacterized SAM-binding protein YcdF (DUF218 family)